MSLITHSFSKEKNKQTYTSSFTTGMEERIERVLVDTIPVNTYFDNEIDNLCTEFGGAAFDANFQFNVTIALTDNDMEVVKEEKIYQSDGRSITDRPATCGDVIEYYVHVRIPLVYTYNYDYEGYFHMDLNPTPGHKHSVAENGVHHWIPAIYDSEPHTIKEHNNEELLVKQMNMYMQPVSIRDVNTKQPISGTLRVSSLFHTDEEKYFNPRDYHYDPSLFRLGKVMLQANSKRDDNMTILDTRTRGGGLDEALSKEIIAKVNKESLYHWDIGYFDGEAYQENAVAIIRLPNTLLKEFSESQVQQAVAKHKAHGMLPIIEYYDPASIEREERNMLGNPEFYNMQHLSYYNPDLSDKEPKIILKDMGTGDNFLLEITDNGRYGITLPGYLVEGMQAIQPELKFWLETGASERIPLFVHVRYTDGTKDSYSTHDISHDKKWLIQKCKAPLDPKKEVQKVDILINDDNASVIGKMFVDYLMVFKDSNFNEGDAEIHKI